MQDNSNIFPSKEGAKALYGLAQDEDLITEINIGGPSEKAYMLTKMLSDKLQELFNTRERVKVVTAIDPQTKQAIPDRLAITAGPVKV